VQALLADGSPDSALLFDINGISRHLPGFLDGALGVLGQYGLPLASLGVLALAWRWARRRPGGAAGAAPGAVAGVLWAGLAAGLGLVLNVAVRALVQRPRPSVSYPGRLHVLMDHAVSGSFASSQATFTMAVAVGLLLVHRRYGLAAMGLAGIEGFLRVLMGANYPTDVLGGYALAAATVLLGAPLAMGVLVPLTQALTRTGAAVVVLARRVPGVKEGAVRWEEPPARDLAA
jgi:undecaprenyl-diphosphatase